ncbi:uncharacterized protein [Aphelocoma coerulescens]|uniref:uncharacterized protein n=1 Tax=Aphelocoma coerulescens TaxID=39617 RepID=UPI0036047305
MGLGPAGTTTEHFIIAFSSVVLCPPQKFCSPFPLHCRVNLEKRTQEAGTEDMAGALVRKIPGSIGVILGAFQIISRAGEWIRKRLRGRKRKKTTKVLDSKLNENLLYLMKQMEPINRVFKKLQKFKLYDLQLLRADLEKIKGKEKEEIARALECKLQKNLRNLCQSIHTLEENVHEWPESTKLNLELLRADLEKIPGKKEKEIARARNPG